MIINITSSPDIDLEDVELASSMISRAAHPDANIIWGAAFDESMNDELNVTVIATGFSNDGSYKAPEVGKAPASAVGGGDSANPDDDPFTPILDIFTKRRS